MPDYRRSSEKREARVLTAIMLILAGAFVLLLVLVFGDHVLPYMSQPR